MKKYAVMRHAKHDDWDEKIFNESKVTLQDSVRRFVILLKQYNIDSLVIWHSPLPRAVETAEYFRDFFLELNTGINIKENEEKDFLFNRRNEIQNNLKNLPSDFVLIVGHFSDIISYGFSQYDKDIPIANCSILYEGKVI